MLDLLEQMKIEQLMQSLAMYRSQQEALKQVSLCMYVCMYVAGPVGTNEDRTVDAISGHV